MRITFLCLFLLFSCCISAQQQAPALFFEHLTIKEKLSHNTVYSILQDRLGYIWVGTQNGLNKYDGYSFQIYPSRTPGQRQLKGRIITALHEDDQGNLWVGTRKNGLNIRRQGQEKFESLEKLKAFSIIEGHEISAINHDQAGNVWVASVGAGIVKYNLETGETTHFDQENSRLSNDIVFDVVADKYGTIWVATAGAGLNILGPDGQFSFSHPLLPHQPNMSGYRKTLLLDDEYLWLGTQGTGLYKIHITSKAFTHYSTESEKNAISSMVVSDLLKTKDGLIYIATDGKGLNVFDKASQQMYSYDYQLDNPNSLNSSALLSLCEDQTGNIWIGTFNGGLNIVKKNKTWFEFFAPMINHSDQLGHRSVLSIHQGKNGTIWVGTDGGGLHTVVETNGKMSFSRWLQPANMGINLQNGIIKAIYEDRQQRLWVSFFGSGLYLFNPKDHTFKRQNISSNLVWSITEQQDGSIWVATLDEGTQVLDPESGLLREFSAPNKALSQGSMVVFTDHTDRVWIGTSENGLYYWDATNEAFVVFEHDPQNSSSISSNDIRAIFQDSKNRIWIGTESGGLNLWLENGQFKRIGIDQGLIANSAMGITEDLTGQIWVSTFMGISHLDPETLNIRNFNFHNKENSNQFNQMATITAANGQLFFGGINGLNAIQLHQLKENNNQAKVIFTDLKIFNKSISAGPQSDNRIILPAPIEVAEEVFLNYTDNSFSIEFTAIDFTNPLENSFLYKMEGFDNQWQTAKNGQHSANYTNLDHGTFTFKVRYGDTTNSLKVHIQPPFWKTYWFRSLAFLLSGGVLLGIGRFIILRRELSHKQALLKAESEILHLKNKNLLTEVNAQNSKLMFASAQIAQRNELLRKIKRQLKNAQRESTADFNKLLFTIDLELENEDYWETFNQYVENIDQDYVNYLLSKHPKLTQNDLRLCILLRMNLSTKEIAALLNVSVRGVEQSRYRLKKRLDLDNETDLIKYIIQTTPNT